jgi:hypothetical protein
MNKIFYVWCCILLIILMTSGFMPNGINLYGAKTESSGPLISSNYSPSNTDDTPLFADDFNGANDTAALKYRGYKIFNMSQPVGTTSWFQGNSTVFNSYNGPSTGYVAANYDNTGSTGNIDNWLILPKIAGGIYYGDSLIFYCRSTNAATQNYPDSIRVMYSSAGDSTPQATSWVELGRFRVPNPPVGQNIWTKKGFKAPAYGYPGRFAIRYSVVNGGVSGTNSDYIGIDALSITRSSAVSISNLSQNSGSFSLTENYPNPFNPSTTFSFSIPKAGIVKLSIYDIQGKAMAVLVNGFTKAGLYKVDFNASGLSSGVYFYRLETEEYTAARKMLLVK